MPHIRRRRGRTLRLISTRLPGALCLCRFDRPSDGAFVTIANRRIRLSLHRVGGIGGVQGRDGGSANGDALPERRRAAFVVMDLSNDSWHAEKRARAGRFLARGQATRLRSTNCHADTRFVSCGLKSTRRRHWITPVPEKIPWTRGTCPHEPL